MANGNSWWAGRTLSFMLGVIAFGTTVSTIVLWAGITPIKADIQKLAVTVKENKLCTTREDHRLSDRLTKVKDDLTEKIVNVEKHNIATDEKLTNILSELRRLNDNIEAIKN